MNQELARRQLAREQRHLEIDSEITKLKAQLRGSAKNLPAECKRIRVRIATLVRERSHLAVY